MVGIQDPKPVHRTVKTPDGQKRRVAGPDVEPQPLNRQQGVLGVFQVIAFGVSFVEPADGIAVALHAEPISVAVADAAANDERFGKILDRILEVGPYGAILAAVAPLAIQLAANHGLIKPGLMQTKTKEELLALAETSEATVGENGQVPSGVGNP